MSSYRIFETVEFVAGLGRLDSRSRRPIESKLKDLIYPQLRDQPHFGASIRKLQGYRPETWRVRLGRFRLFYTIDEQEHIVSILSIDHRKDAYR